MRVQLFTQLQAVDQRLARLVQGRDELLAEFAERDTLRMLRDERRGLAGALKHERGRNTDLQWELEDLELRLRTLEDQERDGPSDPLVARELVMLREHRAQLEEQVLHSLEQIAELEQRLVVADRAVEHAAAAWAAREPQLQADLDQRGSELEAAQMQRQRLADQLPPGALNLYDDLQRRHRGTALAPIRNHQCGVCRARLPAAVFDMLNAPDPLVRCPRCGRVLYIPAPDAP